MDLSKLSDADLMALYSGGDARADAPAANAQPMTARAMPDVQNMSDEQLLALHAMPTPQGGDESAAIGRGIVNGIPVVGPYLLGGLNRTAAAVRTLQNGTSFPDEMKNVQGFSDQTAAQNPKSTLAGEIGGGIVGTAPLIAAAPAAFGVGAGGLAARSGASALSGALLNGADSAVRNEGDLPSVYKAGGVGFALGGLSPVAGMAVGKGANYLAEALASRATPVPGLGNAAATLAGQDLQASGGRQAVVDRLGNLGPDALLLDASPSFQGRAQGLAVQPETRQAITAPLVARNQGTNARLIEALDQAAGPAPVPSQIEGQFQAIREGAGPLYEKALENAPPVDTSAALAALGSQLATAEGPQQAALARARNMLMETLPDGSVVPKTDARNLHNVKGALDSMIAYGDPTIGVPQGSLDRTSGAVARIRGQLNNALEEQAPGYAEANQQYRAAARASDALESGKKVLAGGQNAIHPADFASDFASRPIEQQAALRLGVRGDLDRIVGTRANDLVALRQQVMSDGDWNRAKLAQVFGDDQAKQIFNSVDRETAFRDAYTKIVEGSQTAQRTVSAQGVAPREISAGSSATSGLTLSGLIAGPAGAAGAIGLKGVNLARSAAGRASDIARNEELAKALTTGPGPKLDALIEALDRRIAANGSAESLGQGTDVLVKALLQSQGDRSRRMVPSRFLGQ
jgi:hypothetical protein